MPATPLPPGFPSAMLLAAGRGERMRPLSDSCPKPLLRVGNAPLLDHALARLAEAEVVRCVVNTHYLGTYIAGHIASRTSAPAVSLSAEETPLETGGGVARALQRFPEILATGPFYVVNADALWLDGTQSALRRLAQVWDSGTMDALLLLHPTVSAFGYGGSGDFAMDASGRVRRPKPREVVPFLFTGVQVLHPRLFVGAPDGAFSLNRLYDQALAAGRLYGLRHDGVFYHVGTPQALEFATRTMQAPELRASFF